MPVRSQDPPRTASLQLPPEPPSARAARRFVATTLAGWRWSGPLDEVVLLTSELVANGIAHAVSPLTLTIRSDGKCLRVELGDDSAQRPVVGSHHLDGERGRGLALVEALSQRWGVDPAESDGKVVWFEVTGP